MTVAETALFVCWAVMAAHILIVSVALFICAHPRRVPPTPSVRRRPDESHRTAIGTAVGDDLWADFHATEEYR